MSKYMEWKELKNADLKCGKQYLFLFSNGGRKVLRFSDNFYQSAIAYCEIPPVPQDIIDRYEKEKFEAIMKSYDFFFERENFKCSIEDRERFIDDLQFVNKYIKNIRR